MENCRGVFLNFIRLLINNPKLIGYALFSIDTVNVMGKIIKWLIIYGLIIKAVVFCNNNYSKFIEILNNLGIINSFFEDTSFSQFIRDFIGIIVGGILTLAGSLIVNKRQNIIKNNITRNEKIYSPLYNELIANKLFFHYNGSEVFKSLDEKNMKNNEVSEIGTMKKIDDQIIIQLLLPKFFDISQSSDYLTVMKPVKECYKNLTHSLWNYFSSLFFTQIRVKELISEHCTVTENDLDKWMCKIIEYILRGDQFDFRDFFEGKVDLKEGIPTNGVPIVLYKKITDMFEIEDLRKNYKECLKNKNEITDLLDYIMCRNIRKSGESFKWFT